MGTLTLGVLAERGPVAGCRCSTKIQRQDEDGMTQEQVLDSGIRCPSIHPYLPCYCYLTRTNKACEGHSPTRLESGLKGGVLPASIPSAPSSLPHLAARSPCLQIHLLAVYISPAVHHLCFGKDRSR